MCNRKCSDCEHYMSWVNFGSRACDANENLNGPDNCDMYDISSISIPIDTYYTIEDIESLTEE